jgi:carbon storage regulator
MKKEERLLNQPERYTFALTEELHMLVLTRKAGETIRISNNIVVTVLEVEGYRVRLGIAAPADVPIRRAELPLRCAKVSQDAPAILLALTTEIPESS